MATSKGKLTTVVTIVATAALVFGTVSAGFAQDAGQAGLRRLLLENRIAQVLNDLNLTEAQKSELKSILEQVKAGREEREAEAVKLLTERRDALLAGNDAAVREADRKIAALAQGAVRQAQELFKPFVEGLTERQRNLLSQLVPGLGVARVETAWRAHGEPRRYLRELPMVQRRRGGDAVPMPPNVRQFPQRPELPRLLDRFDRDDVRALRERVMSRFSPGAGRGIAVDRRDAAGLLGAAFRAQSLDLLLEMLD